MASPGFTSVVILWASFLTVCLSCSSQLNYTRIDRDLIRDLHESGFEVVFQRGNEGYALFRLPAIVYHRGYFLAFCEGRMGTADSSEAEIVMKRGLLHGTQVTWDKTVTVIAKIKGSRLANPVPIVDRLVDTVFLAYTVLPPGVEEDTFLQQDLYNQSMLLIKSTDVGKTWSGPTNITEQTLGKINLAPVLYAPGPGHGIQMKSGRLVLQGNFYNKDRNPTHESYKYGTSDHSTVFLSDDNGQNWRPGGYVPYGEDDEGGPIHTNEPTVVELADDSLCINSRTLKKTLPRAQSFSSDGGETFSKPQLADTLIEPQNTGPTGGCMASMLGFEPPQSGLDSNQASHEQPWVLFSNPANKRFRVDMSIRMSTDGCQTWSNPWTIWPDGSAYSDMVQIEHENNDANPSDDDRQFAILFECGIINPTSVVAFKMFTLKDVLHGIDPV